MSVLDRPLVQHAVDEARIEEFIFVTGRNKAVIEKYFDFDHELDGFLRKRRKPRIAKAFRADLLAPGKAVFIHQQQHFGLGHAILCARDLVGDEPFAVLLPTVLIKSKTACIKQLGKLNRKTDGAVLAVREVPAHRVSSHTIIAHNTFKSGRINVTGLLDQPMPEEAPSNLALAGRYIFPSAIFPVLDELRGNANKQIQLSEAIGKLAETTPVLAHRFEGISFDCASQPGLVMANLFYALEHEAISHELIEEFIRTRLRARIGDLLDANALTELADTLQKVAGKRG